MSGNHPMVHRVRDDEAAGRVGDEQRRGICHVRPPRSNRANFSGLRQTRFGLLIVQPACLQLVAGVARLFGSQTLAAMTAARRFSSRTTQDPYLSRAG